MLVDGASVGLGVLLQSCGIALTLVAEDGEPDWEELVASGGLKPGSGGGVSVEEEEEEAEAEVARNKEGLGKAVELEAAEAEVCGIAARRLSVGARLRARLEAAPEATETEAAPPASDLPPPPPAEPSHSDNDFSSSPLSGSSGSGHDVAHLKSLGDAAFHSGQYAVAISRYSEAIEAIGEGCGADARSTALPLAAVLLCNRSAASRLLRSLPAAIRDASRALDLAPTYVKAALRCGVALFEHG